jgi:FkbM family methyltransferase
MNCRDVVRHPPHGIRGSSYHYLPVEGALDSLHFQTVRPKDVPTEPKPDRPKSHDPPIELPAPKKGGYGAMLQGEGDIGDSLQTSLSFGGLTLVVPRSEPTMFYTTFILGEYKRLELREGDFVLDAGANIGDFTIMAARAVGPTGRVLAIEPNAGSVRFLRLKLRENHINNVIVANRFVAASRGIVRLQDVGSYSRLVTEPTSGGREVIADNLDSMISEFGFKTVDVAKIDVEGAELEAISGQRFLEGVRALDIETHSHSIDVRVVGLLSDNGFRVDRIDASSLYSNAVLNLWRHPLNLLAAEVRTGGFGTRMLMNLLGGGHPFPLALSDSDIRLYHCRR